MLPMHHQLPSEFTTGLKLGTELMLESQLLNVYVVKLVVLFSIAICVVRVKKLKVNKFLGHI